MIPKIIHFSWFGSEKPEAVLQAIESWKKIMPDWQIMEWNEKNWDVNQYPFARQMFDQKKWGYIADPIRFDVVNRFGGVYMDTDMLLHKPLDSLLTNTNVWGFQYDNNLHTGLFAGEKNSPLLIEILKMYKDEAYHDIHKMIWTEVSNPVITRMFMEIYPDFKLNGKKQIIGNGTTVVFPKDYFVYLSHNKDANYAEHEFANSWGNARIGSREFVRQLYKIIFGKVSWAKKSAERGRLRSEKEGFKTVD